MAPIVLQQVPQAGVSFERVHAQRLGGCHHRQRNGARAAHRIVVSCIVRRQHLRLAAATSCRQLPRTVCAHSVHRHRDKVCACKYAPRATSIARFHAASSWVGGFFCFGVTQIETVRVFSALTFARHSQRPAKQTPHTHTRSRHTHTHTTIVGLIACARENCWQFRFVNINK